MISILTHKRSVAIVFSLAIFFTYLFLIDRAIGDSILKVTILFGEALLLDYLCFRYGILGRQSSLPLVIFTILSVLFIKDLSYPDLVYGAVWLGAFFFAFEGQENPEKSIHYMIYFGVFMGIAQTINNKSFLLFIPVFLMFIQTGFRSVKGISLSLMYFAMVLFIYCGILYVMELSDHYYSLVPTITFDYSVFDSTVIKLFVPILIISFLVHFISLRSYPFRYPNKSIILNYTMLVQMGIGVILILLMADIDLLPYTLLPGSILIAFAFAYTQEKVFANAAFTALLFIAIATLFLSNQVI